MRHGRVRDLIPQELIEQKILLIRGHKVMVDGDLAMLYGVPTKVLNQAVKRNITKIPCRFYDTAYGSRSC